MLRTEPLFVRLFTEHRAGALAEIDGRAQDASEVDHKYYGNNRAIV